MFASSVVSTMKEYVMANPIPTVCLIIPVSLSLKKKNCPSMTGISANAVITRKYPRLRSPLINLHA